MLEYLLVILALGAGAAAAFRLGKLTPPATVAAWFTGIIVFTGAGYLGLGMLIAFFAMGTLATAHGKSRKALTGDAQQRRNAGQVFANGGAAALICLLIVAAPSAVIPYPLMLAATMASASADTVSSELGTLYGRRFYNILTFGKDENGRDGVVSREGTLFGIAASAVIGCIFVLFTGSWTGFWIVVVAGTMGNFADSVLGATLERNGVIKNDAVNFLNTVAAALAAWGLWAIAA
ncbi:DUF92 domain-containing protein [Chitinophaga caseinilytica]|uniref:DUF92 domain-containing protein n=1 Tax=Chitinophaga caseinilytica TaxID=2267521 RepID=UPI003C2B7305